jgi:hypothetical protein
MIALNAARRTCLALPLALAGALAAVSCQAPPDDAGPAGARTPLTAGMVKKTIEKGRTTQQEVLEVFGPPDILTRKDGREVWTYDKTTLQIEESSGYFTVILAGLESQTIKSSSRSSMVIIYFDEQEVVADYRLSIVRY